jgi:hypothetical protein
VTRPSHRRYTGNPGQLFNQGAGLGLPNMSQLAADLAG